MNINTLKPGNKIGLCNKGYDVNANPYIYGIGIKQDSSSTTVAYMDYYCNAGLKSGYRFYGAVTKILDVSVSSVIHIEKSAVICGDSNLNLRTTRQTRYRSYSNVTFQTPFLIR